MRLWLVRARSIYRTSRRDEGRLACWLVQALTEAAARAYWQDYAANTAEYVIESVERDHRAAIRLH
jgi:hypothetical protein